MTMRFLSGTHSHMDEPAFLDQVMSSSIGRDVVTNDEGSAGASKGAPSAAIAAAQAPPHSCPATNRGRRLIQVGSRRRPWWKWLLIGMLLLFSVIVTVLYVATLAADIGRHHWAGALDASRDAVPAAVGWAALLIVFCTGGRTAAERLLSADSHAVAERAKRAARNEDSVRRAGQRVQKLTVRLAALTAGCDPPATAASRGSQPGQAGPAGQLARQIADTTARLDQARQWLTSAQAALAVSQQDVAAARDKLTSDFTDSVARPGQTAGRVA